MADTKDFNEFGGVRSEKIDDIKIDYDVYGTPVWVEIDVPYNPQGEKAGWTGGSIPVPTDSTAYEEIIKRSSSTFCERMKNVDWQKLEEHAKLQGNENTVYEARKRFMEELPKYRDNESRHAQKSLPNAQKADQKSKPKYEYDSYGGVRSETVNNVTIDYNVFGNPTGRVDVKVPFNSKGYEAGWSGPDVTVPTDSHVYRDIIERSSSTFYERMKNADWKKLEKDYGNEPEFQESRKRFLEEAKKHSNDKNNESGLTSTLLNSAEKVWETFDPEGYAEAKSNPQKLLEKMIPGYKAEQR